MIEECENCGKVVDSLTRFFIVELYTDGSEKNILVCKTCKEGYFPDNEQEIKRVDEIQLQLFKTDHPELYPSLSGAQQIFATYRKQAVRQYLKDIETDMKTENERAIQRQHGCTNCGGTCMVMYRIPMPWPESELFEGDDAPCPACTNTRKTEA